MSWPQIRTTLFVHTRPSTMALLPGALEDTDRWIPHLPSPSWWRPQPRGGQATLDHTGAASPESAAHLKLSLTSLARPNELCLIPCSVKGPLSHRLPSDDTRVFFVLAFIYLSGRDSWGSDNPPVLLKISNISPTFLSHPRTGNILNLPELSSLPRLKE